MTKREEKIERLKSAGYTVTSRRSDGGVELKRNRDCVVVGTRGGLKAQALTTYNWYPIDLAHAVWRGAEENDA